MEHDKPFFTTRGVVLTLDDLTWPEWPDRVAEAGLTTVGVHPWPANELQRVLDFVQSGEGQRFIERCKGLGLQVEYEWHAMEHLLPRELFAKNPEFFRIDEEGERSPDANFCVSSETALSIVGERAVELSRILRPTTSRYFLWGDDGKSWCRCRQCRGLSESDQALLAANRILVALRPMDPAAQVAHIAYYNTITPPRQVKPDPGIFLEFAPIRRRHDVPFAEQDPSLEDNLEALDANLEFFGRDDAQILEYCLDVSRFSGWKKPAKKLDWTPDVFQADLETYGGRGVRNFTTFSCFIDTDYIAAYGPPPLEDYGRRLREWRARG